jgi:hypothetical protein
MAVGTAYFALRDLNENGVPPSISECSRDSERLFRLVIEFEYKRVRLSAVDVGMVPGVFDEEARVASRQPPFTLAGTIDVPLLVGRVMFLLVSERHARQ